MTTHLHHVLLFVAPFWVALYLFWRRASDPRAEATRFILGLGLCAFSSHLGWALFHLPQVWEQPIALLNPAGYSILFVPLGFLLIAPWRAGVARRDAFLAAALGCLPLALVAARVGCLVAGCCHGIPTTLPWGIRVEGSAVPVHPTPLYEIAGYVALHFTITRLKPPRVAPAFLVGFGLIRLLVQPLRAIPPLGAPFIPPALVASVWVVAGLALLPRPLFEKASKAGRALVASRSTEDRGVPSMIANDRSVP